jgi:hypothetical protein
MDFVVPDDWTNPTKNIVCFCKNCGMIWYDNDKTQEDYDKYYTDHYGYDGSLDYDSNYDRLSYLVNIIKNLILDKNALIVDFGGGNERFIEGKLIDSRYTNVKTIEVGNELPYGIELLIASQVLEHLYDVRKVLINLKDHMKPFAAFLIEIPDADMFVFRNDKPILDFQQKHVNHFGPSQLDLLFFTLGYTHAMTVRRPSIYGPLYGAVYIPLIDTYSISKDIVTKTIKEKVEKLNLVDKPFIIWGCGDIAMLVLAKSNNKNLVGYINEDPGFKGATIKGIPIMDHFNFSDDVSIVILAQGQRTALLKHISELNLPNEVIEL